MYLCAGGRLFSDVRLEEMAAVNTAFSECIRLDLVKAVKSPIVS